MRAKQIFIALGLLAVFSAGQVSVSLPTRVVFPSLFSLLSGVPVSAAYVPTPIKSIQYGSIALASATSATATITSVNTGATVVLKLNSGATSASTLSTFQPVHLEEKVELTNATTVTATRITGSANGATAYFEVVEFLPQFVKSRQTGSITCASCTTQTATITSVNTAKAFVPWQGFTSDDTTTYGGKATYVYFPSLTLTNSTTLTFAFGGAAVNSYVMPYTVLEFR